MVEKIGQPGWRPTKVHPLAELFPDLSPDEFDALADHIKANGLQVPIPIDDEGTLIDGRMRLRACDKAGVEPTYQSINGQDPVEYIWGANGKRRQMTKGQMAMIAAMGINLSAMDRSAGKDAGISKAARASGVTRQRIHCALTVKQYAAHLVPQVISAAITLEAAYQQALANKHAIEWQEDGLNKLREIAPDLAHRVTEGEISIEQGKRIYEERMDAEEAMRDSVLLGISNMTRSASGFERSEALRRFPEWIGSSDGIAHVKRYFKGGIKDIAQELEAAQRGIDAVRSVIDSVGRGGKN